MSTAKVNFMPTREFADRVRGAEWDDQHGRVWGGLLDKEQGHPAGLLQPVGFTPPYPIPPTVIEPHPKRQGQVVINYPKWKAEMRRSHRAYQERLTEIAKKLYPNSAGEAMRNPDPMLRAEAGVRPFPVEFIEAQEAGNKWALGIRKPDGTRYAKPGWADTIVAALDDLYISRWSADEDPNTPVDPAKYPDAEEDAEPVLTGVGAGTAFPDAEDDTAPSPRRRR